MHFATLNLTFRVSYALTVFLNPGGVVRHVEILMRTKEDHLIEPLESWLRGQFVQESIFRLLLVAHIHFLNGSALLDIVQEPQPDIDQFGT